MELKSEYVQYPHKVHENIFLLPTEMVLKRKIKKRLFTKWLEL